MTKIIDAPLLSKMIISGANNLSNNRELVDALNVFPVPDGDTGTNMSLTFINASKSVTEISTTDVSEIANAVAKATLRGARGNSGVILSQIFRGISKNIESSDGIDAQTLKAALRGGSDTAYRAVMKPTEGTILTVIRAAAESSEKYNGDDAFELMKQVCLDMAKALKETQEMLPQLKQAGVVDAGGQGLLFIFEGFLASIEGKDIASADNSLASAVKQPAQSSIDTGDIKFAYCTEFIINKYDATKSADKLRSAIEPKGDCMLVIDEDDIVKVHIHTNHPGYVLEQAVKLGEMVNIKIENMREQHTDIINEASDSKKAAPVSEHRETAVVAVANGDGLTELFTELGVTNIIHGGQTMNPSTEDILNAIEEANADNVFILPNNKNIVLAAQQAAEIAECNAVVIESKTIPQGICAMMEFSPTASADENAENMTEALANVISGNVTYAVKDTEMDGIEIHEGDFIGVSGGHIVSDNKDLATATVELVKEIADEDSEIITLYFGEGETEESAQKIADAIEEIFPDADVMIANGGQSVYYYIVSIE